MQRNVALDIIVLQKRRLRYLVLKELIVQMEQELWKNAILVLVAIIVDKELANQFYVRIINFAISQAHLKHAQLESNVR